MTKEEWRRLPKRRGMKVYTVKFNRTRPRGACEWTVESLYKDMATCRRKSSTDNPEGRRLPLLPFC